MPEVYTSKTVKLSCDHCGLEVKALDEIRERVTTSFDRWQCPDCHFVSEIEKDEARAAGDENPYRRTAGSVGEKILGVRVLRKLERPHRKRLNRKSKPKKLAILPDRPRQLFRDKPVSGDVTILTLFAVTLVLLTLYGR